MNFGHVQPYIPGPATKGCKSEHSMAGIIISVHNYGTRLKTCYLVVENDVQILNTTLHENKNKN